MKKKVLITLLSAAVITICGGFTTFKAIEEHQVTYDLNGGFITSDFARSIRWCEEVDVPVAEKEHYVFQGWTDGIEENITTIKHASADVKLTAIYSPEVYTVTFMDGDEEVSKTNYAYGSKTDLSVFTDVITVNHPYENFVGWNIEGKTVTELTDKDFGNKVATAEFEGKTYKISYELDGGEVDNPNSYQYGKGVDSLSDASKSGYVFDGWYSDTEFTNQITSVSKDSHKDMTLYAKFHEAPVATTKSSGVSSSYRRSYSGGNAYTSSSNSSTSYDYSSGMHVPSLGYHVPKVEPGMAYEALDTAGYDTYNYEYWAYDSNGSFYKDDLVSGEDTTGFHRTSTKLYEFYDHASQGLSGAGRKMNAGDEVWVNGVRYTYSGNYIISTDVFNSFDFFENMVRNGYRACLRTCTEDNSSNYVLYLY